MINKIIVNLKKLFNKLQINKKYYKISKIKIVREAIMAVPKSKISRSKRGMRRSHGKLKNCMISTDQKLGYNHIYHHVSSNGYYKGKRVIIIKKDAQ